MKTIILPEGTLLRTYAGTTNVGGMKAEVLMENEQAYFVRPYADHTMLVGKPLQPLKCLTNDSCLKCNNA